MAAVRYEISTMIATIYYQHPSGERATYSRIVDYEIDEHEYAHLEETFFAFVRGEKKKKTFALRLNNQKEITLRLDKIAAILNKPRKLIGD